MKTLGRVNGIISNIVIAKVDGPVGQNEICHVYCGDIRMMAEVIKVIGDEAYVQVYDSTRGLKIGDKVEFERAHQRNGHPSGPDTGGRGPRRDHLYLRCLLLQQQPEGQAYLPPLLQNLRRLRTRQRPALLA